MSVDTHFYPLGSCTMKYNPKRNERLASLPGMLDLHPYQSESSHQGMLELLHSLQAMLAEIAGLDAVSLEVRVTNWGAQRLYARFGFRPVGIRKNYYQEIGEDALIMWLDGIRTPEFRARIRRVIGEMPEGIRPSDT